MDSEPVPAYYEDYSNLSSSQRVKLRAKYRAQCLRLLQSNNPEEALSQGQFVLELTLSLGASNMYDLSVDYLFLSKCALSLQNRKEAIEYAQESITSSALIPSSIDIESQLVLLSCQAEWFSQLESLHDADKLYARLILLAESKAGPQHALTSDAFQTRGLFLLKRMPHRLVDALECFSKAAIIRIALFGMHHPRTADSHFNIASCLRSSGDLAGALKEYAIALEGRIKSFGSSSPEASEVFCAIGLTELQRGDADAAVSYFQKALDIKAGIEGEKTAAVTDLRYNLSVACLEAGDFDKAESHLRQVLEDRDLLFGSSSIEVSHCTFTFADLMMRRSDIEKALALLQLSHKSRVAHLGGQHPLSLACVTKIEYCNALKQKAMLESDDRFLNQL